MPRGVSSEWNKLAHSSLREIIALRHAHSPKLQDVNFQAKTLYPIQIAEDQWRPPGIAETIRRIRTPTPLSAG